MKTTDWLIIQKNKGGFRMPDRQNKQLPSIVSYPERGQGSS